MVNYENGLIYKLECKDPEITDIYIGSTTNFNKRKNQHKSSCNNENDKSHTMPVYQYIREHGGWYNWQMVLVEYVSCRDKKDLNRTETKYIKELDAKLNRCIPGRTQKEYREEKKEILSEKKKIYYEEKKDILLEKQKEYRQEHKEEIAEYHKKYNIDNKTKLNKYRRNYYGKNKDILLEKQAKYNKEKVTCECDSSVSRQSLTRHKTSHKHKKLMEEKNSIV